MSGGLPTKQTTKHIAKPHHKEGTVKGYKIKDTDPSTGKAKWIDASRGLALDNNGDPVAPPGSSPVKGTKNKLPPLGPA
jgi:hypothetical protein